MEYEKNYVFGYPCINLTFLSLSIILLNDCDQETGDTDNEVIPLRNRGKEKPDFTSSKSKVIRQIFQIKYIGYINLIKYSLNGLEKENF